MKHYILKDKEPIPTDLITWGKWMGTADRLVAKTNVMFCRVSTVFLGIDHNFDRFGQPVLFETMTFNAGESEDCWRYRTWDEAEKGHQTIVSETRHRLIQGF